MRTRQWVPVLIAWLTSCSDGGSTADLVLPPSELQGGTADGTVVQVNPVFIVDGIANAPAGASALSGAEVRAFDIHGVLLGTATTAADGSFSMDGLPTGYARFEARADAQSALPDAVIEATIVPGAVIALGRAYPVDRAAASAAALAGVPAEALVAGSLNPLPAGTLVYPQHDDVRPVIGSRPTRVLPADEWLFLVDPEPLTDFGHPVEYVFVDASTGAVTRIGTSYPPLANHGVLWPSRDDLFVYDPPLGTADVPVDALLGAGPEGVQMPLVEEDPDAPDEAPFDPADIASVPHVGDPILQGHFNNSGADGVFVVYIRSGSDHHFFLNLGRMATAFRFEGIPFSSMILQDLTDLPAPDVDTSNLGPAQSIAARAAAVQQDVRAATLHFEPQIAQRLSQGRHSTLIVYICGHGGGGNMIIDFDEDESGTWGFGAADLGVTQTQACRVRVIIQSCSSESFQEDLAARFAGTHHDVVIYAAASKGKGATATPGYVNYIPFGAIVNPPGSHFTTEFADELDILNGDITSVTEVDSNGQTVFVGDIRGQKGMPPPPFVRADHLEICFPGAGTFVRLDQDLGSFSAGTLIALDRIQGGNVAQPDACPEQHLHATSPGGIWIDEQGPFPDPDPTTCGYGVIVQSE